jgi:ribose 5-phosphate isomerase A
MTTADQQKKSVGQAAARLVAAGMVVGLGTGSTARWFIEALASRGLDVTCVATSEESARLAARLGLRLAELNDVAHIDITVDGADEIGPDLTLVKGAGAALLREKLVWEVSRRCVVIADAGKRVARLGACPLPIEVVPFGHRTTAARIRSVLGTCGIGGPLDLRQGPDGPVVTDNGNLIYDARCGAIDDPATLATRLKATTGVVDHGLFVGLATEGLVGTAGGVRHLARPG